MLSAAHCLIESQTHLEDNPGLYKIRLGTTLPQGDSEHLQEINVDEIRIYPVTLSCHLSCTVVGSNFVKTRTLYLFQLHSDIVKNDLVLFKLEFPANFTDYVRPIALPEPAQTFYDSVACYAAGWGATSKLP